MAKFIGTSSKDILIGDRRADVLKGKADNDAIIGGAGKDKLYGNDGADLLSGGKGADILFGGGGLDTFIMTVDGKRDVIADFENDFDLIDISRLRVESFDDLKLIKKGKNVLIKAGGEKFLVKDMKKSDFDADDFVFAPVKAIGFDDLASESGISGALHSPSGTYQGFHFVGFSFLETDEATSTSGYIPTSGDNIVYNDSGVVAEIWSSIPFDLEAADLSAAWRDNLTMVVTGYLGNKRIGSQTITLNTDETTHVEFDDAIFDVVTSVELIAFGGDDNPDTDFNWVQFSMDDLWLLG